MKRMLILLSSAVLSLGMQAQVQEVDGVQWRYRSTDDGFDIKLYGCASDGYAAIPQSTKGTVVIPAAIDDYQIVEINQDAFYGCKYITDFEVDPENTFFECIDGVLYDFEVTTLIRCPQEKSQISIPIGVQEIAAGAFAGCTKLTDIQLPETLTRIRGDAFCGCTALKKIEIPSSVTDVDAGAFSGCPNLTSVTFCGNAPSVMVFYRGAIQLRSPLGERLYFLMRTTITTTCDGNTSTSSFLCDDYVSEGFSSYSCMTDENGTSTTIQESASSYAATEIKNTPLGYDSNLNFDITKSFDSYTDMDGVMSNYHRAAIYDFAGYSNSDFPRTSTYLITYANMNTKGWGGTSDTLPEYWCGRPISFGSDGEDDSCDTQKKTNTSTSLTVTNVVVHYVLNSVQPSIALPLSEDVGYVTVLTEIKSSGAISVPTEWPENYPAFESKYGNNLAKALTTSSGKSDAAGNALLVWQDYVAGTDPTDPDDVFRASVTMVDGKPVVSYTPELSEEETAKRKYTIWGKAKLQDENWIEVGSGEEENYNFFKVTVEMR